MKPTGYKKIAQITLTMMIVSVLLPVIAFASGFNNDLVYKDRSVTGSVYVEGAYDPNVKVEMFSPNGTSLGTATTTTYSVYNDVYTYQFSGSTVSTETYLRLHEVTSDVYADVNDTTSRHSPGGGGGGGGGYFPGGSVTGATITVGADGSIDATVLDNLLASNDIVELKLTGEIALIPAKALVKYVSNKNKMLKIYNDQGTYLLPLYVLNLSDLASKLSTTTDDLRIKVTIAAASTTDNSDITASASALGGTVIAKAVNFGLDGISLDSKTQPVDLANNYISRMIPLTKTADPSKATAVVVDPTTKKLSFVPSLFTSDANGKNEATIKRNSNSVYTVIELNKNFADSKGHWAQSYIDLLANKLVIDGVTDTSFEPERSITRAEFAALVVRSLGLDQRSGSGTFKDVSSSDWFNSVVSTAVYAKIIDGYEDNTFRPNQSITREELAAMVVRALTYAGAKPDVSSSRQSELLAKFSDAKAIVWAQNELAVAIEAGIVEGITDTTIAPTLQATRAQSATMLKRFLTKSNFING